MRGQWTFSRALGEALPQFEAVEREQGKDFGELVRERRRQRGLPLPIGEKVLPFRIGSSHVDASKEIPLPPASSETAADSMSRQVISAEERLREAFQTLAMAEGHGASKRELDTLESAYAHELRNLRVAITAL